MATTIPVSDETKAKYDKHKSDEYRNWDVFMQDVIESYESGDVKTDPGVDTEAIDELQGTLEDMDIERIGQSMVHVDKLGEEIGHMQDQLNQLERTIEGLR